MGYPGKNHKSYQTPKRPWEKARIEAETRLVIEYGLRNKREVWKAQAYLRKYRTGARSLLAIGSGAALYDTKKAELITSLQRAGILGPDADIDAILSLKVQAPLERRLQTLVYRKGLARSVKQARQLITHGHIAINGRRTSIPGYLVNRVEETQVTYFGRSPFVSDSHAEKVRIAKPATGPKAMPQPEGFRGRGRR